MAEITVPQGCTVEDFYWAAGFLEGEGCFANSKSGGSISIDTAQVQLQPLERLKIIMGGYIILRPARTPRSSPIYHHRLNGRNAEKWMMHLRPAMSPKRQRQIDKALALREESRLRGLARPRGEGVGGLCHRGHLVVGSNIVRSGRKGELRCKECTYMLQRQYKERKRIKARLIAPELPLER